MNEKKYLMIDGYMLDKELDKVKKTMTMEKLDSTKILIDTEIKLPNNITLKNVLILMTWL